MYAVANDSAKDGVGEKEWSDSSANREGGIMSVGLSVGVGIERDQPNQLSTVLSQKLFGIQVDSNRRKRCKRCKL